MKFAKYWQQIIVPANKSIFGSDKIPIWGASNESEEQALSEAQQRANRFKAFFSEGFKKQDEYEYSVGFIREEVIEEIKNPRGDTLAVLTRNSYGACVLNTDQVLIGDIDYPSPGMLDRILSIFGKKPKDKAYFLDLIKTYQEKNTHFKIKVYETFGGLRFIICDKLFTSGADTVYQIFKDLEVDPLYAQLCKRQSCFRARLTPKPWRMDIERPPNRFPRQNENETQKFKSWLENYQHASKHKCAAREIATYGSASTHPDVRMVIELHDKIACPSAETLA